MLNQVVLVGRLVSDPEVKEIEGRKVSYITLAVGRPFKNEEGNYDTDFVPITIFDGVATNTSEYCNKGDIIGAKASVRTKTIENEDGTKENIIELIAEKTTFLSSKKKED